MSADQSMPETKLSLEAIYDNFISAIYPGHLEQENPLTPDAFIAAKPHLDSAQQMAVYRGSVVGGLIDNLMNIYPAVLKAVGDNFFDAMAQRYITQYPSRSPSLDDYGEEFADFLAAFKPLADYPYMSDLAKLEWAWHRAFHAPNAQDLVGQKLAELTPEEFEQISFALNPSLHLLESPYPVHDIWRISVGEETNESESASEAETISLEQDQPSYIAIWRYQFSTLVLAMNAVEFALLSEIKQGKAFGTILESLMSKATSDEINAALGNCIAQKWIDDVTL